MHKYAVISYDDSVADINFNMYSTCILYYSII